MNHSASRSFPPPNHRPPFRPPPYFLTPPYYSRQHYRRPPPLAPSNNVLPSLPAAPPPRRFNFVIFLRSNFDRSVAAPWTDVNSLIAQCSPPPVDAEFSSGAVAASLYFREWAHALSFMTSLWDLRLQGVHAFSPMLEAFVCVDSDIEELKEKLKTLFVNFLNGLLKGAEVQNWQSKLKEKCDEIAEVVRLLKEKNKIGVWQNLIERKNGLVKERELISKRLKEFKSAIQCILEYLEGRRGKENEEEEGLQVFMLDGEFNWDRIHSLVLREIRRLEDGLPIYAYRQEILSTIRGEQVMILIGETGSGKSTQLVQFLADSRVAACQALVCTQPRKIAAISLADRVKEESRGCYEDNTIVSYPTFLSSNQFNSKVIYTTDHCLLQHYMSDRNLCGISCIILDEAHERSLNTDLLLEQIRRLLRDRSDLRLVIMSATADAKQLSDYFYGCRIFHVVGRNFPVDVKYICCTSEGTASGIVAPYVYEVIRMTTGIHKTEAEGAILAFLTSQTEVEWACEKFVSPSAVALPLHGKLSFEDQCRIFKIYPGKRKVIFSTNLAETSLTIPGIRFVVDSGMVKESKFEPGTGMNVLKVCRISQSSAQQRAGRAGRMGPGKCFRLYTEYDFESMPSNQEPEICRVHLGVAVLRILALGIKNVQEFDFVDAPSPEAIEMATRNLVQLGAITLKNGIYEITEEGWSLVKLGIEPRLGKLILSCCRHRLGKEGLILAAVMANASSIFCRVGNDDDKLKADCLKVQFCHRNGDLFTLLSVYKEWDTVPGDRRNRWCWENSINAKSMRRCQDTVKELETCLEKELSITIPSYWCWNPYKSTEHDKYLKKVILSALAENVAMYSGHDQLGYEVAFSGQHVQLHPSCSLLVFSEKPNWVVFGELLSITNQYLVCVTAFDFDSLSMLCPPPLFDAPKMQSQKLQVKAMTGFGSTLLKRFCGKSNKSLLYVLSSIQTTCIDERIRVEVNVDKNEILLFASSEDMEKVFSIVSRAVKYEQKWMHNECLEKCLYHDSAASPVALFGSGAEIKHLELDKRSLTVDVYHSDADTVDDKELLMFLEKSTSGSICAIHRFTGVGQEGNDKEKWGSVTFLTPDAASKAAQLNEVEFCGSRLKVLPSRTTFGGDSKMYSFPAVRAKVHWPRRCSKGFAIVKCDIHEVNFMINDFFNLVIGGHYIRSEVSRKCASSIVINGIDKELSEADVLGVLRSATKRRILDFFLVRGDVVANPPSGACEEALLREIFFFMPKKNIHTSCCRVQVLTPEPKDAFMRALITFDGRLHLEAAKALEHLEGKVLPGCLPWQKIKCQQLFHSSLSCSAPVYFAIKKQLDSLLARLNRQMGVDCILEKNDNGSYRVRITANATRTVAELRRPLEQLMRGRTINHASLTLSVLQHLFSKQGIYLMKSLQRETGTHILFDRHTFNVRVFGSPDNVAVVEEKLIQSLVVHHESKQLEIHLRGRGLPVDLMKSVVKKFGPDLRGLKEKVPGAEFTLSTRRHVISIHGNKELKQKVEEIISEIAEMNNGSFDALHCESACPICLCEVEDGYQLEGCSHLFCRLCLVEQFESAIKNLDSFPLCCARCRAPILLTDLRCLLSNEKLDELFRASLGSYVASSGGALRFCPSPDCPSVYRVAGPGAVGEPFVCGACYAETCMRCHMEYHPYLSCERYKEFKEDPDLSLKDWCKGKENVKNCPVCGYMIEKVDGCNHVECKCGQHICWVCLQCYNSSDHCYEHLRIIHLAIN